ncbi:MAG: DUF2637 domain-containing protein [Micromonosporaceae bacterium]
MALAGIAGAISYSHMAELARLHGEVGWRAHAFPLSVDGIEIVASLVLLAHRRAGTRAGWLPWAALVAGTTASVAANVAVGASDPVGRLVAGWPALALLVAIKLLSGLLETSAGHAGPLPGPAGPGRPATVPPGTRSACSGPDQEPVAGTAETGTMQFHRRGDPGGDLAAAARTVRDRLVATGVPINRRNLASGLRAAGHRIRNDRVGHLLRVVTTSDDQGPAPSGDVQPRHQIRPRAGGGRDA